MENYSENYYLLRISLKNVDVIFGTPVSRWISRRPKKNFGLAAIDFAKPPAAGRKKSAKPMVLPPA